MADQWGKERKERIKKTLESFKQQIADLKGLGDSKKLPVLGAHAAKLETAYKELEKECCGDDEQADEQDTQSVTDYK